MGNGSFQRVKRLGRGADHLTLFSAEVANGLKAHLCRPSASAQACHGITVTYSLKPISTSKTRGPGSSVGIATDYGLDGPASNPGGDEIFRPSRSAMGPT